jgi:tRNA pseudouridine32 synthase/23S rRNA pseudouridine746 synthase/23S rRNA pseudouridine1911/1915/1917 synthase
MVDVHLITGRKNQIRVHFAEKGHPVVGDKKYGKGENISKRLALHARSIMFNHPFTHKPMNFDTGIPDEFVRLFRRLNG